MGSVHGYRRGRMEADYVIFLVYIIIFNNIPVSDRYGHGAVKNAEEKKGVSANAIAVPGSEQTRPPSRPARLTTSEAASHSPLSPTRVLLAVFPTFVSPPRLIHVLEVPEGIVRVRTASPSLLRHLCNATCPTCPLSSPNVPNLS